MPYQGRGGRREPSNPLGASLILRDPRVKAMLGRYQRAGSTKTTWSATPYLVDPTKLGHQYQPARWVVSVDSSPAEPEIDPEYPSERWLALKVAGVLVDLQELRKRTGPFRDPGQVADAQRQSIFHAVLPSSGMRPVGGEQPQHAFRAEVHRQMGEMCVNDQSRSLLHVYMQVMAYDPKRGAAPPLTVRVHECPSCEQKDIYAPAAGTVCPGCGTVVYPTDRLRLHDEFDPWGSNLTVAGRFLSAVEHLTTASMLLWLFERNPVVLGRVAFIVDGPLALYGPTAPLRTPMLLLWQDICRQLAEDKHGLPVLVGVEKTGHFVDHGHAIRKHLPKGCVMQLPVDYIAQHIRFRDSLFGKETYYGRAFLYHTNDGRVHALTVPPVDGLAYARQDAIVLGKYPTLQATCALLDAVGTRLYQDALMPVALAHKWASVPLRATKTVLKLFYEENVPRRSEKVASAG